MKNWKSSEQIAQRAIEDLGFIVADANIIFRHNCPNIDLIVFGSDRSTYVQVKSTTKAAGSGCLVVDGSPWTEEQLYHSAPIYNKHDSFVSNYILLIDHQGQDGPKFYLAPPADVEALVRKRGQEFAAKPKRDGTKRSIGFRKELPAVDLERWRDAWHQFGRPVFRE